MTWAAPSLTGASALAKHFMNTLEFFTPERSGWPAPLATTVARAC